MLPESRTTYRDPEIEEGDPTLGHALERVFDAGQTLIVRRNDLLVEELSAHSTQLLGKVASTVLGAAVVLVGWLITVDGIVDVLDDYFARHAVEIAIGFVHLAIGGALLWRRRIAKAAS